MVTTVFLHFKRMCIIELRRTNMLTMATNATILFRIFNHPVTILKT